MENHTKNKNYEKNSIKFPQLASMKSTNYICNKQIKLKNMEELNDKIATLFKMINSNKIERRHFFSKLSEVNNPVRFLKILNDGHFLDVSNNPEPTNYKDKLSHTDAPKWEILPLLDNIFDKIINDQLNEQNDIATASDILNKIIKGLIQQKYVNIKTNNTIIKLALVICGDSNSNLNERNVAKLMFKTLNSAPLNAVMERNLENYVLPYLIRKNRKKVLSGLLRIVLSYKVIKYYHVYKECYPMLSEGFIRNISNKHLKDLIDIMGPELIKICCDKINRASKIDKEYFSLAYVSTKRNSKKLIPEYKYAYQLVALLRNALEKAYKLKNDPSLDRYSNIIEKLFD